MFALLLYAAQIARKTQTHRKEPKMSPELLIENLLAYAKCHLFLPEEDEIYMRNVLLSHFRLSSPYQGEADTTEAENADVPDALMGEIAAFAKSARLCEEGAEERFAANVFGLLMPRPSKVNEEFSRIREREGASKASDYLYSLSVKSGYVQKTAIARNLKWNYDDGKSGLEITVNLSKPEKNNKDIAKLLTAPKGNKYPSCALCKENEGFEGSATHPPRRNLRTVDLTLGGEKWFMQYSPYAYYEEHCIAINEKHVPMHVDNKTPAKLLDFVDVLPNYFIGSNASLPIVGGSILDHEHFQGGKHLMPMHHALVRTCYAHPAFPHLTFGILDWYNSAVRFEGPRDEAEACAAKIIEAWKTFDCPACDILSRTGGTPHNACSPILRKIEDMYSFTIILRNNRTDKTYPDGIFHVHPEHLNIKSEGIGLIEAMGLFILPPRLKRQLAAIADILCGNAEYDETALNAPENDLYLHRNMIKTLLSEGRAASKEEAEARVKDYVNKTCAAILDNTAVFKNDETGRQGFDAFLRSMGFEEV